jgi:hypothetical protein
MQGALPTAAAMGSFVIPTRQASKTGDRVDSALKRAGNRAAGSHVEKGNVYFCPETFRHYAIITDS